VQVHETLLQGRVYCGSPVWVFINFMPLLWLHNELGTGTRVTRLMCPEHRYKHTQWCRVMKILSKDLVCFLGFRCYCKCWDRGVLGCNTRRLEGGGRQVWETCCSSLSSTLQKATIWAITHNFKENYVYKIFCSKNLFTLFCIIFAANSKSFPNEYKSIDLRNGNNCTFSVQ